jgi:hypothetical protein
MGPVGEVQLVVHVSRPKQDDVQLSIHDRGADGHRAIQLVALSVTSLIIFHFRPQVHNFPTIILPSLPLFTRRQCSTNFRARIVTGHAKEHQPDHATFDCSVTATVLRRVLLPQDDRPLNYSTDPKHILCPHGGGVIFYQLDELHKLHSVLGRGVS